jgi:CRISPR-associated protein Cas2
MVVISLEKVPISLRGDLTKWLLEINVGVFVGNVSRRVRENLWKRITDSMKNGKATMVYRMNNEQKLGFETFNSDYEPIDFDGIKLMLRPSPSRTKKLSNLRLGFSKASKRGFANKSTSKTVSIDIFNLKSFVILDIETTGLSKETDDIIEISAIKIYEGKCTEKLSRLIKTNKKLKPIITEITGITDNELQKEGSDIDKTIEELIGFLKRSIIVGHNINFDVSFINRELEKAGKEKLKNRQIDTLQLSRKIFPELDKFSLNNLVESLEIETDALHRGLNDCFAVFEIYKKICERSNLTSE